MRLVWNPDKSSLVDDTILEIATLISEDSFPGKINPSILINHENPIFRKFYFAAFRRVGRTKWAIERFPATPNDSSGFDSFVNELNSLVKQKIKSIKRPVPLYDRHKNSEIQTILEYRQDYLEEIYTRNETLRILQEAEEIDLNEDRFNYYFPKRNKGSNNQHNDQPKLSEAKTKKSESLETLLSRVKKIKKESDIDLSNYSCVSGLIFQGIVRTYLFDNNDPEEVEFEVGKQIRYSDHNGLLHREVFLDNLVNGENIEVKLHNTPENILDSILPQTAALRREYKEKIKSTVICKTKNEELDADYRNNISLDQEAKEMGLEEVGGPIQDIFQYLVFEDILETNGSKLTPFHYKALEAMDSLTPKDIMAMKSYVQAFDRIHNNPEGLETKYSILIKKMQDKEEISEQGLTAFFGEKQTRKRSTSVERRLEIIKKSSEKGMEKTLKEIYHAKFGVKIDKLSEEAIDKLHAIPQEEFDLMYNTILEQKRAKKRQLKSRKSVGLDDFLAFQQRSYDRKTHEKLDQVKQLLDVVKDNIYKRAIECTKRAGLQKDDFEEYPREFKVLSDILSREGVKTNRTEFKETFTGICQSLSGVYGSIASVADEIKKSSEVYISSLEDLIQALEEKTQQDLKELNDIPFIKKIQDLDKECRDRTFKGSRRESNIVQRAAALLRGDFELMSMNFNKVYVDYLRELAEIEDLSPINALNSFSTFFPERERSSELKLKELKPKSITEAFGIHQGEMLVNAERFVACTISAVTPHLSYWNVRGRFLKDYDDLISNPAAQEEILSRALEIESKFSLEPCSKGLSRIYYLVTKLNPREIFDRAYDLQRHHSKESLSTKVRELEFLACESNSNFILQLNEEVFKEISKLKGYDEQMKAVKEKAPEIFNKLKNSGEMVFVLVSDYLSKKAHNTEVLTHYDEFLASDYLDHNPLDRDILKRPHGEIINYLKELRNEDEELFREAITLGRIKPEASPGFFAALKDIGIGFSYGFKRGYQRLKREMKHSISQLKDDYNQDGS